VITIAWSRFNSHHHQHVVASLDKQIRHFTMITGISAWWLRTSRNFSGKKSKIQPENLEMDNS